VGGWTLLLDGSGMEKRPEIHYDNSLVTDVLLKNEALSLELHCSDAVDLDLNIYIKKVEVKNLGDKSRQVRLFFSHDFHLYGNDVGDTAYFDPRTRSIIHYKANRYFLVNCSGVEMKLVSNISLAE